MPSGGNGVGNSAGTSGGSQTFKPYRHLKTLEGHTAAISCVKYSNEGNLLASASLDKSMILWSATNYSLIHRYEGHSSGVSDLAWSSDSHYTCSASDDCTLRIWDARAPYECLKVLRGHTNFVFCVNFNPPSNLIVSGSFDETIRIWEVKTGRCVRVIKEFILYLNLIYRADTDGREANPVWKA
ncbi:hypothetical protein YC2023_034430 [Brassica napus]